MLTDILKEKREREQENKNEDNSNDIETPQDRYYRLQIIGNVISFLIILFILLLLILA
jgi:hypothetical protein